MPQKLLYLLDKEVNNKIWKDRFGETCTNDTGIADEILDSSLNEAIEV